MKRRIIFWHGESASLLEEIEVICDKDEEGVWWYGGTLDEFAKVFNKFMVLDNCLAITFYSNFNPR